MWDYTDKQLIKFDKEYKKVNKNTLDEFQSVFDSTNEELNKRASKTDLERFKRQINNNYEYLSDYGKYQANKYLKRRHLLNGDILWFSIFMAYAYEQYILRALEITTFENVSKEIFETEATKLAEDLKKKIPDINITKEVNDLINTPNSKGYKWDDYNDAMTEYNTTELYNQVIRNIRAGKPLNITSKEFQKILNKQHKRLISVNGNKISGAMDNETIGIANNIKFKTYSILGVNKCRFIAVEDKVTTKMCKSLDGQVFNVHDWNEFKRFSATNEANVRYRVYGMVLGVNLPPIDDHFHYCRSTITYLLEKDTENETRYKLTSQKSYNFKIAEYIDELDDLKHGKINISDKNNKDMGYLEYSIQKDGHIRVENIQVFNENRRQGVGTALYKQLQSMFANEELEFYDVTSDGEKILNKIADISKRKITKYGRKTFWGKIR